MSTKLYAFQAESDTNLWEQIGIMKFFCKEMVLEESIEVQVFRTTKGIVYRVLELGSGLKNKMWEHPVFFPQCNYDSRVENFDQALEDLATEVDDHIRRKMFSVIDIAPKSVEREE